MITKRLVTTKIEIELDGLLFVQTEPIIEEDGVEIARGMPHRRPLEPDQDTRTETDPRLLAVIAAVWTDEVKAAYAEKKRQRQQTGEIGAELPVTRRTR
jgi:hypothetical protein